MEFQTTSNTDRRTALQHLATAFIGAGLLSAVGCKSEGSTQSDTTSLATTPATRPALQPFYLHLLHHSTLVQVDSIFVLGCVHRKPIYNFLAWKQPSHPRKWDLRPTSIKNWTKSATCWKALPQF